MPFVNECSGVERREDREGRSWTMTHTWMGSKYARARSRRLFPTPLGPLTNSISPRLTVKLISVLQSRRQLNSCDYQTGTLATSVCRCKELHNVQ